MNGSGAIAAPHWHSQWHTRGPGEGWHFYEKLMGVNSFGVELALIFLVSAHLPRIGWDCSRIVGSLADVLQLNLLILSLV